MGDALATMRVGDLLPRVVWPSDVDREKARLDPAFTLTNVAAEGCAAAGTLDAATLAGWRAFFAEWTTFRSRATPTFGSANEWDLAQQYARDLSNWQTTLRAKCTVPGPPVLPTDDPDRQVDLSAVKWVAAAIVVAAVVYGATRIL